MDDAQKQINDMEKRQVEIHQIIKNSTEAIDELKIQVEKLERRLYVDNGSPSIQTRLDRHERFIKYANLISYTAIGAVVTLLVKGWL
tara:strand:- start:1387 stop:1647 length:261 start_codon:yes stop_codon:yes gene_type:complete